MTGGSQLIHHRNGFVETYLFFHRIFFLLERRVRKVYRDILLSKQVLLLLLACLCSSIGSSASTRLSVNPQLVKMYGHFYAASRREAKLTTTALALLSWSFILKRNNKQINEHGKLAP